MQGKALQEDKVALTVVDEESDDSIARVVRQQANEFIVKALLVI